MTWALAGAASRNPAEGIPAAFSTFRSSNPQLFLTWTATACSRWACR